MFYFLLHQINQIIHPNDLKLSINNKNNTDEYVSKSIAKYLNDTKKLIDNNLLQWDNMKKYTNPYEFIHTNIPHNNFSISKLKPISRAFFKIIEIYQTFKSIPIFVNIPIKTYHLAEGPGGFIEATAYIRKNKNDKYYGITLIDKSNKNVPGWKKSEKFLTNNTNVIIEQGISKDGNLYNPENFLDCYKRHANSMDIITGDGGFDFSTSYNNQEKMAIRLLFTQMIYAISLQKKSGTFILKIFDMFLKPTIEIIYILSCFYNNVYITKPKTSRYANSEKYIVCTDFLYDNTNKITNKFYNILKVLNNIDYNKHEICGFFNLPIQLYFTTQIEEINAIIIQQQVENILNTIKLINNYNKNKNEKIDNIKMQNIQKCINWCINNNIPYNKYISSSNIFLNDK
jgi:23S rRNA U2552 (ribose-2'-O)-methylase RlmE/FtsJ